MAKKYKLNTIRAKRSYSFREIGTLLDVHTRTVQLWKKEGLETLVDTQKPYLVMGVHLKEFLKKKQFRKRMKLAINEFYCLACRKGVKPLTIEKVNNGIVGNTKNSIRLKGICPTCKRTVNKFTTEERKT